MDSSGISNICIIIKASDTKPFTLHKRLTPIHQYKSSDVILIQNNDIKETIVSKT